MKKVRVTLNLPIVIEGVGSVFEQYTLPNEAHADTEIFDQWLKSVKESVLLRLTEKAEFQVQIMNHDPDHYEFFTANDHPPRGGMEAELPKYFTGEDPYG